MKNNFARTYQGTKINNFSDNRRSGYRWVDNTCICFINNKSYPVIDWSMGGVQIAAVNFPFSINHRLGITLKFKLNDSVLEIDCRAEIIRKASDRIAFKFEPIAKNSRQDFFRVIDFNVANEFSASQM